MAEDHRTQGTRIYGWYESPGQPANMPTVDATFPGVCIFCGGDTSTEDVRTHSLMPVGASRSYFYRTHRTCHERASQADRDAMDEAILDMIQRAGD